MPAGFEVRRIALNMDQVRAYSPPPNPAKTDDSRFGAYVERHGRDSWELDALEPAVLRALITDTIGSMIDVETWNNRIAFEADGQAMLDALAEHYGEIQLSMVDAGFLP